MKKLSTYLLLVLFSFSNLVHADDVRDFEIEGISIGDSLLDHISKKIIKKNKKDYYNNDKFTAVEFEDSIFKNYDGAQIHYKTKGDKYIIYALDFVLLFENNFDKCFKNQDQIVNDLSNTFTSLPLAKLPFISVGINSKSPLFFTLLLNSGYTLELSSLSIGTSIISFGFNIFSQ